MNGVFVLKKSTIVLMSAMLLGGLSIGSTANAAEKTLDSKAVVQFKENTDPVDPVDPTDPTDPIDPVDPIDPTDPVDPGTGGPLSIDFVSKLYFGDQNITGSDMYYDVTPQQFHRKDPITGLPEAATEEGPNFVQVSDNRGGAKGWTLSVTQKDQFTSSAGEILTGAEIIFTNTKISGTSNALAQTGNLVTLDGTGTETIAMSAKEDSGSGTNALYWGEDAAQAAESIQLFVPGSTLKYEDTYTTNLEWKLTDTPGN